MILEVMYPGRLLDLGTTVLDLSGLGGEMGGGESLAELWAGGGGIAPPSFAEATKPIELESRSAWNNLPMQRSLAMDGYLRVITPWRRTAELQKLKGGERSEDVEQAKRMDRLIIDWDRAAPPYRSAEMSESTEKALRALGYLE